MKYLCIILFLAISISSCQQQAVNEKCEKNIIVCFDQIIRHFGIKLEETMAFGDGGNDISMLRHAGIGVAMGNANDDVKAASNYTTTSVDEDGIANALKYFGIVGNPS